MSSQILVAALLGLACNGANAAETVAIFDLVPLVSPSTGEKTIGVFNSQKFGPGSGCLLKYRRADGTVHYSFEPIPPDQIRSDFRQSHVSITTWWADPALCGPETKIAAGPISLTLTAPGPSQPAQSLVLGADKIEMNVNSSEAFAKAFGTPAFRTRNRLFVGNKVNQYVSVRFGDRVNLADYDALNLDLDLKMVKASVNTGCVESAPTQKADAQRCYDRRKHRTHFRAGLGHLMWQDPRCRRRIAADPVCKYQNRSLQVSLSIFNEAHEFFDSNFHVQETDDRGTIPIFRVDLRDLLPPGTTSNPFNSAGDHADIKGDLLPIFRRALLKSEHECHLPPRLIKSDGTTESDDEYIAHYSLGSMNIGYEISGLADMSFDVNRYALTGRKASDRNSRTTSAGVPSRRACD